MGEAEVGARACAACGQESPGDALYCARCGAVVAPGPVTGEPLQVFPMAALLVLHYLTLGIFSVLWLNIYHGSLPRRRPDDPTVGRAVGFLFIPIYSIYWYFFTHLRLCERLDEECALHGHEAARLRQLALWTCVLNWIPGVDLVVYLALYPILAARLQTQVNALAAAQAAAGRRRPTRRICSLCRFANPADAVYCASCGSKLVPETSAQAP